MNIQTFDIDFETILMKAAVDKKYLQYDVKSGLYRNSTTRKMLTIFKLGNLTPKEVNEIIQDTK